MRETAHPSAELIAREFHKTYERLAPEFSYRTRVESALPWEQVPEDNRNLMVAVVDELLIRGVIQASGLAAVEDDGPAAS